MPRKKTPGPSDPDASRETASGARATDASFPIVVIGGSAGAIKAFTRLLGAVPADTGMAFVIVLHLAPDRESALTEILQRATPMPVTEAHGDVEISRDHVYVIPPNRDLEFDGGRLHAHPLGPGRAQAHSVDHCMASLAATHAHRSIGIVMSGTANDGTLGLAEIKAAGGVTFAQDDSAEHEDMPRSAIAAGVVDYVLPPERIGKELARIASHPYIARERGEEPAVRADEVTFGRVLDVVRRESGVDFSGYKRTTLQRRITRRMLLHRLESLDAYLERLKSDSAEVRALYHDVLINVTSFFRNPAAFKVLADQVFPEIVRDRKPSEPVRMWVLGCSTGEEAYSLAIAFTEFALANGHRHRLQVFATDVNGAGIDRARAGIYSKAIAKEVSLDRLKRFFSEADGGYRVNKQIREMCIFARQNALEDPPFSHIDLVSCRNMLIYLEAGLQDRLLQVLHYALKPEGFLWLGSSETVGAQREAFEAADPKHKIYRRKGGGQMHWSQVAPVTRWSPHPHLTPLPARTPGREGIDPHREADRIMLSRYAPPGVLVDKDLHVVQFRGDTGPFLSPAPGRASLSLLKMLREGLLVGVRGALTRAARDLVPVREEGLRVRSEAGWREVDVAVVPIRSMEPSEGAFLVLFEETAARRESRASAREAEARAILDQVMPAHGESAVQEISRLKQELEATREYLQSVIEQQEAANEELQSANEEVQSANEELQSINEELETSKEEIQSTNEELSTVNDELQARNTELSIANDDLLNLFASVNMAIVMLGRDLRIRRFTQPAQRILNLIQPDVGRPLSDIKLDFDLPDLETVMSDVIDNATSREKDVQIRGHWYSLRVRPYRAEDNRIEGAVIALIDIDNNKRAEQSVRESEQRFQMLADTAPVLIWWNDQQGCRFVNRAYQQFVGESEEQIHRKGHEAFVHPEDRAAYLEAYAAAVRSRERFEMRLRFRDAEGAYRWMKMVGIPRFAGQQFTGYVGCTFDVTDMAEAEAALRELDRGKNEFLAVLAHELRNPLSAVRNASRLLADPRDEEALAQARAIIDRQSVHMVRMIDDLLDISRITYGKIRLQKEAVSLMATLNAAIAATRPLREDLQQQLATEFPEDEIVLEGDPVRLDQVFVNLLANAAKFTPRGGKAWLIVERRVAPGSPEVVVRIRDNGVGISAAMLPRVFDLFVQGDAPSQHTRTGIGLGLTLAKRLVDLHGGTIEAHSSGDALGSEFIVRLPLVEPARRARAPAPAVSDAAASRRRVLLVEDNADSGQSLRLLLSRAGHDVRLVEDGASALAAAIALQPHLVVLDIGLPDMDGYVVAGQLRDDPRTRDAFIVAATGYGRDEDRARSHAAGIDEHMTKPVDIDALLRRLAGLTSSA